MILNIIESWGKKILVENIIEISRNSVVCYCANVNFLVSVFVLWLGKMLALGQAEWKVYRNSSYH